MAGQRSYCGKVLLYGEYTILIGGRAVAVPLRASSCRWQLGNKTDLGLEGLAQYLRAKSAVCDVWLDTKSFLKDVRQGWHLPTNIPVGYGAGSSGSVVAAVYDRYGDKADLSLPQLTSRLSHIEGFYHGTSSGLDPLISLLGQAIVSEQGRQEQASISQRNLQHFYLLDTGKSRSTRPLVDWFKGQLETDTSFKQHMADLCSYQDRAIEALLREDTDQLRYCTQVISELQFTHLSHLIPADLIDWWRDTLEDVHTMPKLCGAGGGGYILILADDPKRTSINIPKGYASMSILGDIQD